jgi:hypothetical protein
LTRAESSATQLYETSVPKPKQSACLSFIGQLDSYVRLKGEAFAKVLLRNTVGIETADVLEAMLFCGFRSQFECVGFVALINIRKNRAVVD